MNDEAHRMTVERGGDDPIDMPSRQEIEALKRDAELLQMRLDAIVGNGVPLHANPIHFERIESEPRE